MRAHTTRANFARRRRRLVRKYVDYKESTAHLQPLQTEEDGQFTDRNQAVEIPRPIFRHSRLNSKLNGNDAFLINHCA